MGLRSRLPQENHLNFDSFCELLKFLNLTYSKWETRRSWVFLKTLCCLVSQPQYQKLPPPPIERVKLLVQNQNEMIKQGRLDKPYNGVLDCLRRVLATEGVYPLWRGNLANVLRYFPTQALNF